MQLVKGKQRVKNEWVVLDGDATLPAVGSIIVPIARWVGERSELRGREGRIGVLIDGGDELEAIIDDLESFALVALYFPSFVDGRNYSNARLLRERYGYRGELRAIGEVLRDQLFYLVRCGFDSYLIPDECDIAEFLRGLDDYPFVYQAANDRRTPAYRLRAGSA